MDRFWLIGVLVGVAAVVYFMIVGEVSQPAFSLWGGAFLTATYVGRIRKERSQLFILLLWYLVLYAWAVAWPPT